MLKQLLCGGMLLSSGFAYAQGGNNNSTPDRLDPANFNPGYTSATAAAALSGKTTPHEKNVVKEPAADDRSVSQGLPPAKQDMEAAVVAPEIENIDRSKK